MKRQALLLGVCTAAVLAGPVLAADGASGMMEFRWGKNAFNFEGMPSGPQPLRNLSRRPDGTAEADERLQRVLTCDPGMGVVSSSLIAAAPVRVPGRGPREGRAAPAQ